MVLPATAAPKSERGPGIGLAVSQCVPTPRWPIGVVVADASSGQKNVTRGSRRAVAQSQPWTKWRYAPMTTSTNRRLKSLRIMRVRLIPARAPLPDVLQQEARAGVVLRIQFKQLLEAFLGVLRVAAPVRHEREAVERAQQRPVMRRIPVDVRRRLSFEEFQRFLLRLLVERFRVVEPLLVEVDGAEAVQRVGVVRIARQHAQEGLFGLAVHARLQGGPAGGEQMLDLLRGKFRVFHVHGCRASSGEPPSIEMTTDETSVNCSSVLSTWARMDRTRHEPATA